MSQQNSIENLTVAMGAGESRIFMVSGEYFEILEAPNPIDVLLSDINGAQRARLYQASASYFSKGVEFAVIQITSATAQTVRVVYGTGESGTRRTTGSMTISGPVALDTATLLALEILNNRPEAPSGSYAQFNLAAVNAADPVFLAAANVNGAVVLSAHAMSANDTTVPSGGFLAKATAPTGPVDGQVIAALIGMSGGNASFCELKSAQFVPAGLGLYYITNVTETYTKSRSCRYKLL